MSTSPLALELAAQIVAQEARALPPRGTDAAPVFRVLETLRPHLATLMGVIGFRALLARALVLANAEIPWLRAIHVGAAGSLEGIDGLGEQLSPAEKTEGGTAVLAELLALLVNFIGEDLTVRLVSDLWPDLPGDGVTVAKETDR